MALVTVDATADASGAATWCAALERGDVLVLPATPVAWSAAELDAVRGGGATAPAHKHVSYRLRDDRLFGVRRAAGDPAVLRAALRRYAVEMSRALAEWLAPYAAHWRPDVVSCRMEAEEARRLPLRSRNDRLHVDAFPSRPTNGDRILRVFTNVHPSQPRCWIIGEPFEVFIGRFVDDPGAPVPLPRRRTWWHRLRPRLARVAPSAAAPLVGRTAYDAFMLRLHDHQKADLAWQASAPRHQWRFAPGSSWVVFSDAVPHAVLGGRFAVEQTFFVPRAALLAPERAPASLLEARCGVALTDPGAPGR